MKLLNLKINNFLSFKEADLNLDTAGLVAVEGLNLDNNGASSNGSGKSSLFIAIHWCLFGDTDKKISADEVVNSKVGKNCSVITHWLDELTDIEYRFSRYRKDSKHKNKLRLEQKLPGHDWEDKTDGKNDLTQQALEQALGMDATVFTASCSVSQEDALDIPAMKDSELKSLLENALPIAKLSPAYLKYKANLIDLEKELYSYNLLLGSITGQIETRNILRGDLLKRQKDYISKRETNIADKKKEIDRLKGLIPLLDASLVDKFAYRGTIDKLYRKRQELNGDPSLGYRLQASRKLVERLEKDLATLDASDDCPTCKRPVEAKDLFEHRKELDDQLVGAILEVMKAEKEAEVVKANQELIEKIDNKIGDLEEAIQKSNEALFELEGIYQAIKFEEKALADMATDPYEATLKYGMNELETLEKQKAKVEDKITPLKDEIDVLRNVVDVLSPKGFRYHLLESITPELNDKTNHYLSMLTDGKIGAIWSTVTRLGSGEYKEAFSIKVNMNGRTNFGSLSGGQKKKVRLACWFALQDLIAKRAEKDVKLWVCDEVDGALDTAGIERLMSLLEEKARTRETVLVISHNSMRDYIANHITVVMEDDVSTIRGFLNAK